MKPRATKICDSKRGCGLLKDLAKDFGRNPRTLDCREPICKECKGLYATNMRDVVGERIAHGRPYSNKFSFDYGRLPPLWKERLPIAQAKISKANMEKIEEYNDSEP